MRLASELYTHATSRTSHSTSSYPPTPLDRVSSACTIVTGEADVGIVDIFVLFLFQPESRCQKPTEQVRRNDKFSCHITYLLVAGPIQMAFSACERATTTKAYAWETSGFVGCAICVITTLWLRTQARSRPEEMMALSLKYTGKMRC